MSFDVAFATPFKEPCSSELMCKQAGVYDATSSPVYGSRLTGGARQMIVSRHSSKSGDNMNEHGTGFEGTKDWDSSSIGNESGDHDSDTGMESMSSADLHHISHENSKNYRMSCSFCVEPEQKRLEELITDVERLRTEKGDLLKANVTCKTDIKKLKDRFGIVNKTNSNISC